MKAVVQRVCRAGVVVEGRSVAEIGRGLVAFVAVEVGDGPPEVAFLAEKLTRLRVFDDAQGRLQASVSDVQGEILLVSNFTVAGDCHKGRRPSFHRAARAEVARGVMEALEAETARRGVVVRVGSFGETMEVSVVNDGPVTVVIETPARPLPGVGTA